jgi:hypothetical protein
MNPGDRHALYPQIPIVKRQAFHWPGNARMRGANPS